MSRREDNINRDSKNLLEDSGFNFSQHFSDGINAIRFSELLTMSGLVLNNKIRWISFHGDYDFAYLIKLLTGCDLPESKKEFDDVLKIFFPHVFDVKYIFHCFNQVSVGMLFCEPPHQDVEQILQRVDNLMYQNKISKTIPS